MLGEDGIEFDESIVVGKFNEEEKTTRKSVV
jgi:hypothetical protein